MLAPGDQLRNAYRMYAGRPWMVRHLCSEQGSWADV